MMKIITITALLFSSISAFSMNDKTEEDLDYKEIIEDMMINPKDVVIQYMKGVWDDKDLSIVDEYIHSDCIIHSLLGNYEGKDYMKNVLAAWYKGFEDLTVTNILTICENDTVMVLWKAQGTHTGEFKGISPTHKNVSYTGNSVYKIKDGKICEYWAFLDMNHILNQIS